MTVLYQVSGAVDTSGDSVDSIMTVSMAQT